MKKSFVSSFSLVLSLMTLSDTITLAGDKVTTPVTSLGKYRPTTSKESASINTRVYSLDLDCANLLADFSQHLTHSNGYVSVTHMTNYQTQAQSWGGYTSTNLTKAANGNLIGTGNRLVSTRTTATAREARAAAEGYGNKFAAASQPFNVDAPDPISYTVNPTLKTISFGQNGPYKMTCVDHTFAIVNTGDSVETFSFKKVRGL